MKFRNMDETKAFKELAETSAPVLKNVLTAKRIADFSIKEANLTYNYAALPVDGTTMEILQSLCDEQELIPKFRALAKGEIMNTGENRRVLHHLLRGALVKTDVPEIEKFYENELDRIRDFSAKVRNGEILGSTGKAFKNVVQIGIGGSDLGPRAIYLALDNAYGHEIQAKFISNVDPDDALAVISALNLEETLFVLVSKSGTTLETLTNQEIVMNALKEAGLEVNRHLVAVTSNTSPLAKSPDVLTAFFMDDFIGGRYSSSSAVGGVILSIAFGFDVFKSFLDGAHEADVAAMNPDILENAAMADAAIGVYMRNVLNFPYTAVLPYSQALSRFPAHLQQLDMESNGKSVSRDGRKISYKTGPVVFGEPGTNGQHSFYQLLHQGTDTVPLQFIGFKSNQREGDMDVQGSTSREKLNANLCAQIVAFARGKNDGNPNKYFSGERYSSLILADRLDAYTLGALLAHYENKVMFQGFMWNLNSFDQEGVQLGKLLAKKVLSGCREDEVLYAYSSMFGLGD